MSRFAELLRATHPDALTVPEELDAAWRWMEDRGHVIERDGRMWLTAYAGDRVLGVVFDTGLTLDGWFTGDAPDARTLLPVGQADGAGRCRPGGGGVRRGERRSRCRGRRRAPGTCV